MAVIKVINPEDLPANYVEWQHGPIFITNAEANALYTAMRRAPEHCVDFVARELGYSCDYRTTLFTVVVGNSAEGEVKIVTGYLPIGAE